MKVVVVGGSFAGLACALRLLKGGVEDVTVLDAKPSPTTNTTGGMANWWVADDPSMGVVPEEARAAYIRALHLVAPSGKSAWARFTSPVGTVINPEKYLAYYVAQVEQRGGKVMRQAAFQDMGWSKSTAGKLVRFRTSTGQLQDLQADWVVAADGARSTVRRSVGGKEPRDDDLHFGYEETLDNYGRMYEQDVVHIFIDFKIAPKGYWWVFPDDDRGDRIRVGLGIPQSVGTSPKEKFEQLLLTHPEFQRPARKVVGGQYATAKLPHSNRVGRVLFAGDAGNFCSPVTGGGIGFGIMSGGMAAESILSGRDYDRIWKKRLKPILRRHYLLKKMLYSWDERDFDALIDATATFKFDEDALNVDPTPMMFGLIRHMIAKKPGLVPKFVRLAF